METVRACIESHADATPDSDFLIAPDVERGLDYSRLKIAVDELGERLDKLGLGRSAKVAFLLNNGFWTTQLFLGVMANNRVIVPLNAVAGTNQLVHVLEGWARFEYEGQGEHTIRKGDVVLQPPRIKHRELAVSDDFAVLEIVAPANFETIVVDPPA